ncbi:hypothetical protein ERO13_A01G018300v2 [Gossypium hirsutum]|uniref:Disease resistance protein SUMM2 n=2 Tax=Gossypium TaxID=3633 RepID=A0A1U8N8N0_GOSHI|nr:disease resistance protein SUMM2-like [Gossypium hirsutum]KAB2095180.1 hypothetical protein ES319_A01G019100v1 [Gossypium barbadense]KAG4212937.1 hypothetical protein ERO13_A01G018300v2 [Gossypium hirsutum]
MGNIFSISLSLDPIITRCSDCATGQASYICNLEDNLHALQTEVAGLKELRSDLMSRVRIAEDEQRLKRLNQVEGWLSRAETLINDADQLIFQSSQHVDNLCMGGCCSTHPRSSIKFGKQIAKKLQEVKDQKENGDFSDVASKPPPPSSTERPSEPTVGLEFYLNKVWSCLQKEQVGIIGIYGLGGVGKTTLLNQINNKFHDTTHDYHVIWAVASQDLPIERVQEQIAERIGISNNGWKSIDEKAADIFNVLRKKKFALLLDDIWERFDLTRAGVPLPTQGNGSKVIFTTRRVDVCCQMQPNMDNNIGVECLPPGEAFKLFEKKVGSETLRMHPDICKLAEAVVEECAGLPLALITIGRAMASKKTLREWEYAIEVLRQSAASVLPGVGKEMYPKLKFSYDCLPDERFRSSFLYCSLYPEDYFIDKDKLVDFWIGEGFLDEHTNLSSARNQGHFIIGSLIDACLLEKQGNHRIKMHDVIRDMALWIAGESEKEKFFVKSGVQLKEQPKAKKWEEVTRMSLMSNQIENLTEILECPKLQTLFLGSNDLKVIMDDFFNSMPMLRVLDLSSNWNLEELPVGIAKLVSLEHLNLSGTGIRKLPVELKALAKLKYLNLEWTRDLEMIPQQLISSFSKLQVLKMVRCGYGCLLVLEEMEHLKHLNVLTITFRSASELEKASRFNKFFSCAIEVVSLEDFRDSRSLTIMALAKLQHLCTLTLSRCWDLEEVKIERNITEGAGCFHSLRTVILDECNHLRDVSWVTFAPHLEELYILDCKGLEEIISEEKLGEVAELKGNSNLFSKLEILHLWGLPKLKTIYQHALPFPQLKEIYIRRCPMLKKLPLNSNSAKGQRLVIFGEEGCWKDVEWEDESTKIAFLPSFRPF